MRKYLSLILVFFILTMSMPVSAGVGVKATVTESAIFVDGRQVWINGFSISGYNYFKLRDIAEILSGTTSQFDVSWNGQRNTIEIVTGKPYDNIELYNKYYNSRKSYTLVKSTSKILLNGIEKSITAYTIDGYNYFKLRDLAELIPFDVEWDGVNNSILIYSKTPDNAYRVKTAFDVNENTKTPYFSRWSGTTLSFLVDNKDGSISVVEANEYNKKVTIEIYDQQYNLISYKSIDFELPYFGSYYSGEKYNYIAYGDSNREEKDDKEVIRIVRYDKEFNRVDSISINGGVSYTIVPFRASSGRMMEHDNTLIFHTSRLRYTTEDGLNHQSQLTLIIDTESMRVINYLGRFQSNHVSHSFGQFVQFDGSHHVLVDHGDAYPRSVVLHKSNYISGYNVDYTVVDLFPIPGKIGANCTGVSIGGFEISSGSYIVAMNSVDHSLVTEYTDFVLKGIEKDQRDIFICSVPKNKLSKEYVKQTMLARYTGSEKIGSVPQLVKISDDKMMVLWQEFNISGKPGALKYVFIDENGEPCTEVESVYNFRLSECKPIVIRDSVVWYTNDNGLRYFYSIPLTT